MLAEEGNIINNCLLLEEYTSIFKSAIRGNVTAFKLLLNRRNMNKYDSNIIVRLIYGLPFIMLFLMTKSQF